MTNAPLVVLLLFLGDGGPSFRDVEIQSPFDIYLLTNPLLMDVTGAKVIRLPDGNRVVLGVASTPVKDNSAADRKRAETVCKNRALASIVAEKKGVQLAHVEKLQKKVVVVLEAGGKEKGKSVTEYLELTRSAVEGVTRDFPVVGRWKSADGGLYYLAVGGILDGKGRLVETRGKLNK